MNHRVSTLTSLLFLTLLLSTGCTRESLLVSDDSALEDALPVAAKEEIPFRGLWVNTGNPPVPPEETPDGCQAYFTTSQTGHATHLGDLTGTGATCASNVRIVEDPPFNFTGGAAPFFVADFSNEMTWTTADGDELHLSPNGGTFVQSLTDGTTSIRGVLHVDGGTGRFDGVTGSVDVVGTGEANVDRLRFDGRIEYDASLRAVQ